jgi:hypothetical protein
MFAAGVALEVGIVGAGIIVVLATMIVAGRPRDGGGAGQMTPPGAPTPHPAAPAIDAAPSAGPERRTVARAPVVRPVVLRRHARVAVAEGGAGAAGPAEQRTFAMDVSVGGLLLAGPSDLAIGEIIDVSLDLDQPIGARARVVRETADGLKGVAFEAIAEPDRDRLERYVRTGQPG